MALRVYNRDFADRVIEQYSRLEGVFLIGEENVDVRHRLEELTKPGGEKEKAKAGCDRAQSNLTKHQDELAEARSELTAATWRKRDSVPELLGPMFDGYGRSREKFTDNVIQVAEGSSLSAGQIDVESLKDRARRVFDSTAAEERTVSELRGFDDRSIEGYDLMNVAVVGSKESTMADLIEKLGNSDWVLHGRDYLSVSDGACPFCQQEVPGSLAQELELLFDVTYEAQRERLARFSSTYSSESSNLLASARRVGTDSPILSGDETLELAIARLERLLQENIATIQKKIETPSSVVQLKEVADEIESINLRIREANAKIEENNRQIRQRVKERPALVSDCWRYFVAEVIRDDLTKFMSDRARLVPAIEGITKSLGIAQQTLSNVEKEERELNSQLVSSEPTIRRMNSMLRSTGFTSFKLAQSGDLPDGYTIVRDDGAIEARSLSEGERTFLSFLYFYYRLQDRASGDASKESVAVIDDPITSMDSDVMVVVSALIRSLIDEAVDGAGNVRQVIVLTHNVHFHREVTYQFGKKVDTRRSYFVIHKDMVDGNAIHRYESNPIRSMYGRLWDEVKAAGTAVGYQSPVGLENVMRRILETYFAVLGNIGQEKVIDRFAGQERLVCRSLYMWANGGSHSIFDDNDYSPSVQSVATYLKVFRQIFVETNQLPHYEMMMREGAFAQDPA